MALKESEKTLIGFALLAGGIALVFVFGLPQWDLYSQQTQQITGLKQEKEGLLTQKDALQSQISVLEQNTNIPLDLKVQTYTDQDREQMIKRLLDHIVNLSTKAGNKFISLGPTPADELATPVAPPVSQEQDESASAQNNTSGEKEAPPVPAPLLNTFEYDLAVRGSYDTVQKFLKLVDNQKTLIEIGRIAIENELLSEGSATRDVLLDPGRPVKLTANIRLSMQRVD